MRCQCNHLKRVIQFTLISSHRQCMFSACHQRVSSAHSVNVIPGLTVLLPCLEFLVSSCTKSTNEIRIGIRKLPRVIPREVYQQLRLPQRLYVFLKITTTKQSLCLALFFKIIYHFVVHNSLTAANDNRPTQSSVRSLEKPEKCSLPYTNVQTSILKFYFKQS